MSRKSEKIVNKGAITQVLGCLMKDPSLLIDSRFPITLNDTPEMFHKIILSSLINLKEDGIETFDIPTIYNYISQFPANLKIYEDNNGNDYIDTIQNIADVKNFEYNFTMLKKFTLLREISEQGMDISDVWDYSEADPDEIAVMNKRVGSMKDNDILNHFLGKLNSISEGFTSDVQKFDSGSNVREIVRKLKDSPIVGIPFVDPVLTTAFRGQLLGKMIVESTPTSGGKSRKMIANCCNLSIPFIYDLKQHKWVPTGVPPQSSLYINTEMSEQEVLTVALAYLSGLNEEDILLGRMDEQEEKRLEQAVTLMEQFPFKISIISDYDIDDIQRIINEHIYKYGCKYVYFDYLMSTPKLLAYCTRKSGMALREDQVLLQLSMMLKHFAVRHGVFIYTATQVNGASVGDGEESRGVAVVRGAKSIIDKCDGAFVVFRPTKKDLDGVKDILSKKFLSTKDCTYGISIFKNRGGKMTAVYCFYNMDLGNVRSVPLFVTNTRYEPIEVDLLDIIFSDEEVLGEDILAQVLADDKDIDDKLIQDEIDW